ncbi:MAG: bifunctional riboflavin kinase/FAD synthetase [Zunongwangia sp.]|uniref:Riboflavin biosynthesis protein n=2 Tax=Zunongwangia profunda TaxID=398743 RepID=D5BET0_ZUNPS|nr:bifunctional riboflavin kinase/FAD synthetase [Zunongwangia profunda]MAG88885.1 bifunctional riboflavin kinase/FAD synthetase [Flavobacteriaceae bacterium]MAO34654.1 bifunctional riboflavin kinase/FAD synthetase [Zunongwangia sp.]ADF50809.1 riboflavin kinase / FAD synthetase [Zunongwangia profunda SM-A87]MAS69802.1 bifunctional riboflavin kinase/FAD synthetase [Zunongwangia sp.]HAJ81271.1 bifunctional riboflavin kinase/FAD synthetase [Zunongwangia profunda]
MEIHKGASAFKSDKPTVVTIGTFDGVHAGHQKIIKRLVDSARANNLESVILTFFPHPRMVLQKESGIKLINTIEERTDILEQSGIDHLVIHPFTMQFSRLTAREFVKEILVEKLRAKKVIIGYDHRFGRNRTANINDLKKFGEEFDFEVEEITRQDIEEVAVSSTKIRTALEEGRVEKANNYLRHPFSLKGEVVKGRGLGKEFNYPTANINIAEDYKLIPKNGVYVVRSVIEGETYFGMMSIGTNPTVGGTSRTIESFFFKLDKDLYGKRLKIDLLIRIRDEKKFNSVEELKLAMKQDEAFSKQYIKDNYVE